MILHDTLGVGIHPDVDEQEYHRDSALSQSGAKTLLDCPARYRWERDNPRPPTPQMELGSVAHALVLDQPVVHVEVEAANWMTKDAKAARDDARAAGKIPLLTKELDRARATAQAVRDHPYAGAVLAAEGRNELSMWWRDTATNVLCRGRIDRLTADNYGTPTIVDIKTTSSVRPWSFAKSAADFGYHIQDAAYEDGYTNLTGDQPSYVLIVVETEAPHFVAVYTIPKEARDVGLDKWRQALTTFQHCTDTGEWPAYPITPQPLALPAYAL